MSSPAIRTQGLGVTFGATKALDGLTLEVPRGIVFGFLGPNGSGKTTTIRVLLGLLDPTTGTAEVLGLDTRRDAAGIRARCGALLEHAGLYERLTARENLEAFARFWGMPAAERGSRIKELLTQCGLWERSDEVVATWSRGMKQKLAIARALLHRPELVFLDEPTAGLDPIAAAMIREQLSQLAAHEGVSIFMNTHNLAEAERLCALVGVIRQGRLVAVAPPSNVGAPEGITRTQVVVGGLNDAIVRLVAGLDGVIAARADGRCLVVDLRSADQVPEVIAALVGAGARVESVRADAGSLEDAFPALAGRTP